MIISARYRNNILTPARTFDQKIISQTDAYFVSLFLDVSVSYRFSIIVGTLTSSKPPRPSLPSTTNNQQQQDEPKSQTCSATPRIQRCGLVGGRVDIGCRSLSSSKQFREHARRWRRNRHRMRPTLCAKTRTAQMVFVGFATHKKNFLWCCSLMLLWRMLRALK